MDIFILEVHMFQPCVGAGCLRKCLFFPVEYFTSFVIIHKGVFFFFFFKKKREVVNSRSAYTDKQSLLFPGYLFERQIQPSGSSID